MRSRNQPGVRVAHVVDCFGAGGIATGVLGLIRLSHVQVDHTIISLKDDFRLLSELPSRPQTFVIQPNWSKIAGVGLRLANLIRSNRIDILHCNNHFAWLDCSIAARMVGCACVETFHGVEHPVEEFGAVVRWKCRQAAKHSDVVTAVGHASRRMVCRLGCLEELDVQVIPNGVDLQRFRPLKSTDPRRLEIRATLGLNSDAPLVIHVAGLRPVKDQATLLRAWNSVNSGQNGKSSKPTLLIAGEGECRDELTRLVDELGLQQSVVFLGQRKDLTTILPACDIFVLSSLSEGLSFAVLEAMASGLPVVTTDVGGNKELVSDGENGFVVPPRDPMALAAALQKLLEKPELGRRLGVNGRSIAENRHDEARQAEHYVELYARLATQSRPNRRKQKSHELPGRLFHSRQFAEPD